MTIVSKPEGLCLSGNLPELILSDSADIRVRLLDGANVLLDETYTPDSNARVTLDLRDAVSNALSFTIPTADVFVQPSLYKTFTLLLNDSSYSFSAIRAGVRYLSVTPAEFLAASFLSWQEQQKRVTYLQPEWLTYFAASTTYLYAKAYFADGTADTLKLANLTAGAAVTVNLQFGRIAALFARQPVYIDAYVTNADSPSATRLSYIQRYLLTRSTLRDEQYFCFQNSLGGLDSIRCSGETKAVPEYTPETAQSHSVEHTIYVDKKDSKTQNTGWLSREAARWIQDMFTSLGCYYYSSGDLLPIVVDEAGVEQSSLDDMTAFEFTYRPADASRYLNVVRNMDSLPEVLEVVDPEGSLFFLAPRLIDFPELALGDTAVFPIQSPFEQQWYRASYGAIANDLLLKVDSRLTPMYATKDWVSYQGFLKSITREMVEDVLTGLVTSHHHNSSEIEGDIGIDQVAGLTEALSGKLDKSVFDDLFEKVNLGTEASPAWSIKAKYGLWSDSFISALGTGSSGGGSGGSSYLHDLLDVNGSIQNAAAGDLLSARLVNGNVQWTNVSQASIVPDLSGYAYASGANAYGTWNINILGNADTVDGKHAGDFSTMVRVSDWNSVTYKAGDVLVGSNTAASSPSGDYLTAIALPLDNNLGYVRLLGIDVDGTVWKRQQHGGSWGGWVNAADGGNAAQLNTTRYIFGQPFNGTGDVRGTLYNADSVVLVNGSVYGPGVIELFGATPYIDFHFGNSGTDYTSRIIEYTSGRLLISGSLDIGDTYGTNNRLYVSGNIGTNGRLNFTNSGNSVLTSPYQIYFYPNGASVAPENSAFVIASSAIFPGSTNAVDIGLSSPRFKDGWFTGNIVTKGNVGVGTASPGRKLHVEGAILAANDWLYTTGSTGWANSTYGGGIFMRDTTYVRTYGGKRFHVENTDNAIDGSGTAAAISTGGGISATKTIWAGGNVYANGAVTALATGTSDLRLKEALQPFDGLSLMERIGRAFAHRWNGQALSLNPQLSNAHVNHSWSAQRVAEVLPQYILHDLYGEGYLGINRDGLLPIVWNGVLEVSDEVTTLKKKVAALQEEVNHLKQPLCPS